MRAKAEVEKAYDTLFARFCELSKNGTHMMSAEIQSLDAKCQALGWVLEEYDELDEDYHAR